MPTAIVTITCPQCGGKVQGIEATDQAQVVPCTYCGTELHVPRVGEEIIHEKVIEKVVVVEQAPMPAVMSSVRPSNTGLRIGIAVALAAFGLIMMLVLHSQADEDISRIDQESAADKQCEQSCKDSCANAGDHRTDTASTGDPELDKSVDKTMREADVTMCETTCWQKNNCYGARTR